MMTAKSYQVIVTGQLVPEAQLEQVKEKVARLFNAPAAKLAALFAGTRVVVKKGLDQTAAERYVAALCEAGLIALAEPIPDSVASAAQAAPTLAPVGVTLIDLPRITPPVIDTSGLSVAAVAGNLVESTPPPAPKIDASRFTAAPVGETLVEAPAIDPPAIDTSRLTMAPAGERLIDPPKVHAPDIDTSHLDMTPVGSDVGELRQAEFPPPPATDHLTLE